MSVCFSEIISLLGLNIGSSGGFRTIFSKLLHQQFLPTVEYTVMENEHAHLQHPPMEFFYILALWIKSSLL